MFFVSKYNDVATLVLSKPFLHNPKFTFVGLTETTSKSGDIPVLEFLYPRYSTEAQYESLIRYVMEKIISMNSTRGYVTYHTSTHYLYHPRTLDHEKISYMIQIYNKNRDFTGDKYIFRFHNEEYYFENRAVEPKMYIISNYCYGYV